MSKLFLLMALSLSSISAMRMSSHKSSLRCQDNKGNVISWEDCNSYSSCVALKNKKNDKIAGDLTSSLDYDLNNL